MKKVLSAILCSALVAAAAGADDHANIKAGVGVVYGQDIEAIGIQVNAYKAHAEEMLGFLNSFSQSAMIGADFTYYLADDPVDFFTVNVNLLPMFKESDGLGLYGIGGLNWARTSVEIFGVSASDSSIGLNLGGGAVKPMSFGDVFAEAKVVLGDAGQVVVGVGLRRGF